MLKNGTFDLVAISWQVTEGRFKEFEFSESLYDVKLFKK